MSRIEVIQVLTTVKNTVHSKQKGHSIAHKINEN